MIGIKQIHSVDVLAWKHTPEIDWHIQHGAVYEIYRDTRLAGIVWLSLLPEGMCVLSYDVDSKVAGKELIRGAIYVRKWLSETYSTIIGFVDYNNDIGFKFAYRVSFHPSTNVYTDEKKLKIIFIYRSLKFFTNQPVK